MFHLHLSETGERLIQAETGISHELAANMISCLSGEEVEQLEHILSKTLNAMK
ncbi:hypothetical protein D3C81_2310190 [compost metagenome]